MSVFKQDFQVILMQFVHRAHFDKHYSVFSLLLFERQFCMFPEINLKISYRHKMLLLIQEIK